MENFFTHKLSYKQKKNSKYGENFIDSIDVYSSNHSLSSFMVEKENMMKNYDLMNGRIDMKDFLPYNYETEEESIGKFQHYDIIVSKIKALGGEMVKRPFEYSALAIDEDAYNERLEAKTKMLQRYWEKKLKAALEGKEEEQDYNLENIERYTTRTFKTSGEVEANYLLEHYLRKNKIEQEINDGIYDVFTVAKVCHYVGEINGEAVLELRNPVYLNYHRSPDNKRLEYSEWVSYEHRLTASDIYDKWGDKEEVQKGLESLTGFTGFGFTSNNRASEFYSPNDDYYTQRTHSKSYNRDTWDSAGNWQNYLYRVLHVEWISMAKIYILTRNEYGEEVEYIVDEEYKLNKSMGDIKLDPLWIREVWEGYKCGTGPDSFCFGIDRKKIQYNNLYNLNSAKLGYHGLVFNSRNSEPVSMVDRGFPYQYLFIVLHVQLERLLASDIGRVLMADVNMIPDQYSPEQWMYLLKEFKVAFVDSASPKAKKSNFSNMGTADLSATANAISQRIQLLQYISGRCNEVMGITKQREGMFSPNSNVTDNQAAIQQSANTTESEFNMYDSYIEDLLTSFLETVKVVHKDNPRKINAYVKGGIIPVNTENLLLHDYDVFIANRSRHKEVLKIIEQLTMPMIQNGYQVSEIAELLLNDKSLSKNLEELKILEKKRADIEQQNQKSQQEMNDKKIQAEQQAQKNELDTKIKLEQMKIDNEIQLKKMDIQLQNSLKEFDGLTKEFTNTSKEEQTNALVNAQKEKVYNKRETDMARLAMEQDMLSKKIEVDKKELEFKLKKLSQIKNSK